MSGSLAKIKVMKLSVCLTQFFQPSPYFSWARRMKSCLRESNRACLCAESERQTMIRENRLGSNLPELQQLVTIFRLQETWRQGIYKNAQINCKPSAKIIFVLAVMIMKSSNLKSTETFFQYPILWKKILHKFTMRQNSSHLIGLEKSCDHFSPLWLV